MSQSRIYIYGIINSSEASDIGLEGHHIFTIGYRDIAAIASDFEKAGNINEHMTEYAKFHEKVVELMMLRFNILPMRLLTVFSRKEDVIAMLQKHYDIFKKNFERLDKKVEFGLKVIWHPEIIKESIVRACERHEEDANPAISPARMFMEKKFEIYKQDKALQKYAEEYIGKIDAFLAGFAIEKKLKKLQTEKLLLNASYLIMKDHQDEFKRAFNTLKSTYGEFEYQFSGPWAPYNFIDMETSSVEAGMSNIIDEVLKH
jgi:hypothetical protein